MRDKLVTVAGVIIVLAILIILNNRLRPREKPLPSPERDFAELTASAPKGKRMVAVVETNKGTFSFVLFPDDAPGTVANFIELAKKGFYDNTIFHRVVPGFVIQGGDPKGTGAGGPGYTIKAEFNKRKHVAGMVAMARSADPDSAGSQFYVCLAPAPNLDGAYTVFGQVIEGMDVVQAIGSAPTDANERPLEKIVMKKVYVKEEIPESK